MPTPNDLDVQHIEMVAQDALLLHRPPRPLRRYLTCTAQDTGVSVRVNEAADLAAVETALRQFGYRVERPDAIAGDGHQPRTRVAGWSTEALRARGETLGAAIERLADTAGFASTVGRATEAYRAFRDEGFRPEAARARASRRAGRDVNVATAREIGPLVHKKLTPDDPDIAARVAANDQLYMRVTNLLFRHTRLATDTLAWVSAHADTLPADEAKTRALEAMRPQITNLRATAVREADHDLFQDAYWWIYEQAGTLALGFASWITARHNPHHAPELGEAFRQWAADGLTDADGVDVLTDRQTRPAYQPTGYPPPPGRTTHDPASDPVPGPVAGSAAQIAAADFPEPHTDPRIKPDAAARPPDAPTGPATGPACPDRSPHRGPS